jgi:hypothetical protein
MSEEPWITTTERIPYLVFPVGLPADINGADVVRCLQSKADHFSDIYNARAYSLVADHSVIVCVRTRCKMSECAIIVFLKARVSLEGSGAEDPICGLAYKGLTALNKLLDRGSGQSQLTLLRIDPAEVSRKAPN